MQEERDWRLGDGEILEGAVSRKERKGAKTQTEEIGKLGDGEILEGAVSRKESKEAKTQGKEIRKLWDWGIGKFMELESRTIHLHHSRFTIND